MPLDAEAAAFFGFSQDFIPRLSLPPLYLRLEDISRLYTPRSTAALSRVHTSPHFCVDISLSLRGVIIRRARIGPHYHAGEAPSRDIIIREFISRFPADSASTRCEFTGLLFSALWLPEGFAARAAALGPRRRVMQSPRPEM